LQSRFKYFIRSVQRKNNKLFRCKYYYINIWVLNCKPCITEIDFLNTLPEKVNKNISFIMVSSHSDNAVNSFLERNGITMKDYTFLNEKKDFISDIFKETRVTNETFPLHVVMDNRGNFLAYLFGSIHNEVLAAPLIGFLNNLEQNIPLRRDL
jgi:hypothetical protein